MEKTGRNVNQGESRCSCVRRPDSAEILPAGVGAPAAGLDTIAKSLGLTSAEPRVLLLAVVEVGGVSDVASALDISEATVKSHLQCLFGKTGARRRIDLVRLVAAAAGPVAPLA